MSEKSSSAVATSSEPPDEHETVAVNVVERRCRVWCCLSYLGTYLSRCFQREFELLVEDDPAHLGTDRESTCGSTTSCSTSLGLCGLVNLGNTCFMNSALQCLSSTVPLRKYLTGDFSYPLASANSENGTAGAITITFSNLLKEMWSEEHSPVRPAELKRLLGSAAERFAGYSQQDAQEFLTYLLQSLHEDLNRPLPESDETGSLSCGQVLSEKEQAEQVWKNYSKHNNSKVVELFQGQLKTRLTCGSEECGKNLSLNFDPFMFLPVPLPDEVVVPPSTYERDVSLMRPTSYTLHDCLSLMTQETCSENKWYCEQCDSDINMKRKVDIWKLPKILIVYLKRFRATPKKRYKMETAIEFPLELDLTPFMGSHEDGQPHYELFAIIDHYGSIYGGHYTATTLRNGDWYRFDDEIVQRLDSVKDVMNSRAAYVLFYERKSSRTKTKVTKLDVSKEQKNDNIALFQLQELA